MRTLQQADEHNGVVGQIFTDAAQISAHFDAELAQLRSRSDARSQQEGGRMDAAGGQNDLARAKLSLLAADPRGNAGDAAAVECEAGRDGAADDGEIAAAPHRCVEIADRARRALARPIAHRHCAVAVAKVAIHVCNEGNLPLLRVRMHCLRK